MTKRSDDMPESWWGESNALRHGLGYVGAILAVLAALVLRLALNPVLQHRAPWIFFYPAVAITAWTLGVGPGLLAIALSAAIGVWFFMPIKVVGFGHVGSDITLLTVYVLSASIMVVWGGATQRTQARLRAEREERIRAESVAAESLETFRSIFDNADGDAIILTDASGVIVAWNPGAEALFGWSSAEAVGRDLGLIETNAEAQTGSERWLVTKSSDAIWGSVSTTTLYHADGRLRGRITVVRDMSEQRRLAELLRRQNEELERRVAERTADLREANAELEGFTYSVSHDMRTPLRGIVANSTLLLEDYGNQLPSEGRQRLERLAASARRLGLLIDDLLTYARLYKQSPVPVRMDLAAMFREVLADEAGNVPVEVVAPKEMTAYGDPGLVRLVIQNLVNNAVKYRSPERPLRIELGQVAGEEPTFFVRDNGTGFDMEYVGKLFLPFERLHRDDVPGTGIGLANVKRVIERHGGRVWAEGVLGEGATFWFTLPSPKN